MTDNGETDRSPGETARALIRGLDTATLGTTMISSGTNDEAFWPYTSLVLVACDFDATPILLISQLAEHTKNIVSDDRVSLLYDATSQGSERLSGSRVSILGRAVHDDKPETAARYLSRHPSAKRYSEFADFDFFRVEVAKAHLVAGFGRINWIDGHNLMLPPKTSHTFAKNSAETELTTNMNQKHPEKVRFLASKQGLDGNGWTMTGCDPEGCDLRRNGEVARVTFPHPVFSVADAHEVLSQMCKLR